jgi:hypothetical protein
MVVILVEHLRSTRDESVAYSAFSTYILLVLHHLACISKLSLPANCIDFQSYPAINNWGSSTRIARILPSELVGHKSGVPQSAIIISEAWPDALKEYVPTA